MREAQAIVHTGQCGTTTGGSEVHVWNGAPIVGYPCQCGDKFYDRVHPGPEITEYEEHRRESRE